MLSVKFFQTVYAHQALRLARLPSTIVLRGYPPTVPLASHAHWGVRCPQTEASEPWAWGCMQGMHARDVCNGMSAGDASKGMSARDVAMGDVAIGVSSAYGLLPVVYQEATC